VVRYIAQMHARFAKLLLYRRQALVAIAVGHTIIAVYNINLTLVNPA
jgi:hypothetical protein